MMAEELSDVSAPTTPLPPFLNYQLGSQACLHVMGGEPVSWPDFHTPRTFVSEKVHEKRGSGRCMRALNLVMSSNRGKL